jgi:PAS domain S-box-containing protein
MGIDNQKTKSIDDLDPNQMAYEYIRNVFIQAPVAIVVYKGSSFVVDIINEKALEMWGKTYKQVINKPLFEISPELRQSQEPLLTSVYITGKPFAGTEVPAQYKRDGKLYEGFFNFIVQPVHNLEGTIVGITQIGTDITQEVIARRKIEESERALYDSNELFRLISNSIPALVFYIDENMRYKNVNAAFSQWFDIEPEMVIGKTVKAFVGDAAWKIIKPHLENAYDGSVSEFEAEIPYRHGGLKWVRPVYIPHKDRDGKVLGVIVMITDISSSKMHEMSLRKYREIFETVEVSLWEEDFTEVKAAIDDLKEQGIQDFAEYFNTHTEFVQKAMSLIKVLDVNEATIRMFEAANKSELLGSLPKIFTDETLPVFIQELITVAEGKSFMQAETVLYTIKGNARHTVFTMKLPQPREKFDRVLFSVLDITEKKKEENKIKMQAAEFENAVQERTRQLEEELRKLKEKYREVE